MTEIPMPRIVSRAEWGQARDAILAREKAHTREGDAIAAARRRLPMTEVPPVTVEGPAGARRAGGGVRRPPAAHRLLSHVARRAAVRGPVRGLHVVDVSHADAGLPPRPGRHLRRQCLRA